MQGGYESSYAASAVAQAARCFVLLNILPSHSRSFEIALLSRAYASLQYSIETMYLVPFPTLKNGLRVVQSLKMSPFDKWRR